MEQDFDITQAEYITMVAGKCCIAQECDGQKTAPSLIEFAQANAVKVFERRFTTLSKEYASKYKLYIENETMQQQLVDWDIDCTKFWFLHLFIIDYTNACFSHIIDFEKHNVSELLEELTRLLSDIQPNNFNLEIKVNKKKLTTKNYMVGKALLAGLEQIRLPSDTANLRAANRQFTDLGRYNIARMKFATMLFRTFLDSHLSPAQKGRMNFVGKCLYLIDIAKDERYWYGCNPKLERNCKRYELKLYGKITIDGTEYIAEKFDVGKDIADKTKKCKIEPNYHNSFYYTQF